MKIDSNLVVLITGGASGLGLATVTMFVEHGAKVFACDINEQNLTFLKEKHPSVYTMVCDVTKEE